MRLTFLAILALFSGARAEDDGPITPERADALFAWFDQLPLPGLHGSELVRVWPGGEWQGVQKKWEPDRYLAFLVEDGAKSFRALTPDGRVESHPKNGADPSEDGFVGFRKVSLPDEARQFLTELGAPDYTDDVRRRRFSLTYHEFQAQDAEFEVENLALARWCAKAGDKQLALSLLNAPHQQSGGSDQASASDSVEVRLQKAFSVVLRMHAYRAFAERKMTRPDLLASFEKIVALCPKADLSEERKAMQILERMIREDAVRPALTEEQIAALPPATRAYELIFRLRDECRSMARVSEDPEAGPGNGAMRDLLALGPVAAPALIKALGDDSFTRETIACSESVRVARVRDFALDALAVVSGCKFSVPTNANEPRQSEGKTAATRSRDGSERGERNYLAECLAAGGVPFEEFIRVWVNAQPDEAIPFVGEQLRAAADMKERVTLLRALWKVRDPRCVEFLARQMVEGPEIGDRVAAAYGLRYLDDARAIPAMCTEWEKVVAAQGKGNWPAIDENDDAFSNPWRLANFLITSNAPEGILFLAGHAGLLPADWRANIVSRLADFSRGESDETTEPPPESAKKAIEDALIGFLTDTGAYPLDVTMDTKLIGGARICDLAAFDLQELWPKKYEFDRWLSPAGRARQCLTAANVRAREMGDPLFPLPPEPAKKPVDPKLERIISDVQIDGPSAHGAMAGKLAGLRGSPLDGAALVAALRAHFTKPEKEIHGFALEIARYADVSGISIQLVTVPGPSIEANELCQADILCNINSTAPENLRTRRQSSLQRWSEQQSWQPFLHAVEEVAARPPQTAFTISIQFNSAARFRTFRPHVIRVLAGARAFLW